MTPGDSVRAVERLPGGSAGDSILDSGPVVVGASDDALECHNRVHVVLRTREGFGAAAVASAERTH